MTRTSPNKAIFIYPKAHDATKVFVPLFTGILALALVATEKYASYGRYEFLHFLQFMPCGHYSQRKIYSAFVCARGEYANILGHVRERDVTAWVNYYICAGSEHLLVFLLKCNKNYIILKKMPSAAQWNILHHPSTNRT